MGPKDKVEFDEARHQYKLLNPRPRRKTAKTSRGDARRAAGSRSRDSPSSVETDEEDWDEDEMDDLLSVSFFAYPPLSC